MNRIEYIPGDLVMTDGVPLGTAKGVVYRVTVTDPNKTLRLKDGTVLKGVVCLNNIECAELGDKGYLMCECYAWVKDIVPLKLSTEILKKNGWKYIGNKYTLKFRNANYLTAEFIDNEVYLNINQKTLLFSIMYLHELQHLLFGLGLNSNMEV